MIHLAAPALTGNESLYVNDCLARNQLSAGRYVELFEQEFARRLNVNHALACSSGTAALHLALLALEVGPGDEVLVPDLTYVATANAVSYCGAKPVLVDVDPLSWCLDVGRAEGLVTARTVGILPVHLYGHVGDMTAVQSFAQRQGLFVLEDAAEAFGSSYADEPAGALGQAGVFSFYGNKTITTGEGGMVTTDDDGLADRVRLLRGQGVDPKRHYWHKEIGYNYRMAELQGAVGLAQVERAGWHIAQRRKVAAWYRRHLPFVGQQLTGEQEEPAVWMNVVLVDERDRVAQALAEAGVETRPAFVPLHRLPMYEAAGREFPVADYVSGRGLCLPSHASLSEEDVIEVCQKLKRALE